VSLVRLARICLAAGLAGVVLVVALGGTFVWRVHAADRELDALLAIQRDIGVLSVAGDTLMLVDASPAVYAAVRRDARDLERRLRALADVHPEVRSGITAIGLMTEMLAQVEAGALGVGAPDGQGWGPLGLTAGEQTLLTQMAAHGVALDAAAAEAVRAVRRDIAVDALGAGLTFAGAAVVFALASVAAFWLLDARVAEPVRRLSATVRAIDAGERDARAPDEGGDEIGELGRAFNGMLDRLDRSRAVLEVAGRVARFGGWRWQVDGDRVVWSDETAAIHGEPAGYEPTPEAAMVYYRGADRDRIQARFDACRTAGRAFDEIFEIETAAGTRRRIRNVGEPERDADGRVRAVRGACQDVTEQQAQRRQLELLEAACARLNDLVVVTEAPRDAPERARVVYVNDAFERLTGHDRARARAADATLLEGTDSDPATVAQLREGFEQRRPVRAEIKQVRASGQVVWLELDVVPLPDTGEDVTHMVAVGRDVTERRELDARLHQAQKMETIGQLTGGVAHDFNNLLTIILGNAEMVADLAVDDDVRAMGETTRRAAERGAQLTADLLAFSRRQPLAPVPTDLHELVRASTGLLRRAVHEGVELALSLEAARPVATVDPAKLQAALLNLVVNARQALDAHGTIWIETADARLDAAYAARHVEVAPGDYVAIAVSDDGAGMTPEVVAQAFEPFFTTKGPGVGTGLGLSSVYGFAKQSRGHAKIYSEPGVGTTVRLYLPRADAAAAEMSASPPTPAARGAGQHVLVVEDDAELRAHVLGRLDHLGYRATGAADAAAALDVLAHADDVELLFTDVILPGEMNGRELAEAARARRPELRVLYTSGYTRNVVVHHGRVDAGVELLSKPYRDADLADRLRKLLG
jgi:PAS domain S-box-containing protein